ncbi:uncharacterized protein si:ch211-142k18.1 isoform X1 [Syngnathus scovelli]|uniref:uncharacterized protein si:ch211-142k18.1 isoform X1 n=1 Tax=Syngnathus scovelli TaxID=161590 RepID=UPI0021101F9B|nr:uncharacterized protein si:ch211-142k18.1 isoform X1 [Syngnathus scovelli]
MNRFVTHKTGGGNTSIGHKAAHISYYTVEVTHLASWDERSKETAPIEMNDDDCLLMLAGERLEDEDDGGEVAASARQQAANSTCEDLQGMTTDLCPALRFITRLPASGGIGIEKKHFRQFQPFPRQCDLPWPGRSLLADVRGWLVGSGAPRTAFIYSDSSSVPQHEDSCFKLIVTLAVERRKRFSPTGLLRGTAIADPAARSGASGNA